jgi:hypothetical protein
VATPLELTADRNAAHSVSLPADRFDRSALESDVADQVHRAGRVIEMTAKYDDAE